MKHAVVLLLAVFTQAMFAQSPAIVPKQGHNGVIYSVAVSPDGRIIATGGDDSQIRLWSMATGKLLRTIKHHRYFVTSLAFSPDSRSLLSGAMDGLAHINDVETGRLVRSIGHSRPKVAYNSDGTYFSLSGDLKTSVYSADTSRHDALQTFGSAQAVFTPDGRSIVIEQYDLIRYSVERGEQEAKVSLDLSAYEATPDIFDMQLSPDSRLLLTHMRERYKEENFGVLWSFETGKELLRIQDPQGPSLNIAFSPRGTYIAAAFDWRPIRIYSTAARREIMQIGTGDACVTAFAITPDEKFLVAGYGDGALRMWSLESGREVRTFYQPRNLTYYFDVTKDGKQLIAQEGRDLRLWSLETVNPVRRYTGHSGDISGLQILPDQQHFVTASDDSTIRLWSIDSERPLRTIARHAGLIYSMSVSPDGKYVLTGAKDHTAKLWSIEHGEEVRSYSGFEYYVKLTAISPDGEYFAFVADPDLDTKKVTVCKMDGGDEVASFIVGLKNDVVSLEFSPDSRRVLFGTGAKGIQTWKFLDEKEPHQFVDKGFASRLVYSHDGKLLAQSPMSGPVIFLRDAATGEELKVYRFDDQYIYDIRFSADDRYLYVAFGTNAVRILDRQTNTWVDLLSSGKEDWLICTSDGYWDGSLNGGSLVDMVRKLDSWNIDQFAVQNNRPDIILSRMPRARRDFIDYLGMLYRKRLRKSGLAPTFAKLDYLVPVSKISSLTAAGRSAALECSLTDPSGHLKSYNIFVNDVPLFGAKGKPASGKQKAVKERIELTSGENKIEVSCTNEQGVESYRDVRYVEGAAGSVPNLYFLAFGVSKYRNASYNLQYADKDANDLAAVMSRMQGRGFGAVKVRVLTNEQVTPEAIRASKDFVKDAKPDDHFVLFIAGHGMHDRDAEATYYFLTSNADVNNLKGTAADFETIEDLLQGVPPRNKLFLMDACESGELDDEVQGQTIAAASDAGMTSRGFKTAAKPSEAAGQQTGGRGYLFQRDRYIYNDLVRRSGAIVFSSSKGGELSYERSDIRNGLFTNAMITALSSTAADANADGTVSTDELRAYVSAEVAKASGGLQHPTVDRDNIFQKFGFQVK